MQILQIVNTLNIQEVRIPEVDNAKFLGVTIDNQLTWIPRLNNLLKKLKSATGMLKHSRNKLPYIMHYLRATCFIASQY